MSILQKLKLKLDNVLWKTDLLSARFSIALGSIFWALLLWWPGVLFTPTRTTYRLMSQIADENVWGMLFFIHTIFACYTLYSNTRNKIAFIGDAFLGSILWTTATTTCFASHWVYSVTYAPPAAMSAELALMMAAWWWMIRWIVDLKRKSPKGVSDGQQ